MPCMRPASFEKPIQECAVGSADSLERGNIWKKSAQLFPPKTRWTSLHYPQSWNQSAAEKVSTFVGTEYVKFTSKQRSICKSFSLRDKALAVHCFRRPLTQLLILWFCCVCKTHILPHSSKNSSNTADVSWFRSEEAQSCGRTYCYHTHFSETIQISRVYHSFSTPLMSWRSQTF